MKRLLSAALVALALSVPVSRLRAQDGVTPSIACEATLNDAKQQAWRDYDDCQASFMQWVRNWWSGANTCTSDRDNAMRQAQQDYRDCMGRI